MRKKISLFGVTTLCLLWLSSCGIPLPADKMNYVGEWRAPGMYLLILADGSVKYKRIKKGFTKSIEAPLQGFDRDDFIVGIGSLKTTFRVDKPPYQENGQWKMVVDGVTLIRVNNLRNQTSI